MKQTSEPNILAHHRIILSEVLSIPTAPFAEHKVIDYIGRFCAHRAGVTCTRDGAGNLLAHVQLHGHKTRRPVCITAHLDHPGFVAARMQGKGRLLAHWRGGVPPEYFMDAAVRFDVDGRWIPGRVCRIATIMRSGQKRVDTALIDVPCAIPQGAIGMWDFPDPRIRGTRIHARGCDDLAGAAAMLCSIDALIRRNIACDAYFLFTRAEEVGFIGAIAAARRQTIPKKCFVVAMETSSERPHAKMGDGPILRVGDRASTFTPAATAYCHRVARELAAADPAFIFQRKLMDGGTCESSAYHALGYDTTGVCIALGNYHNVDVKRRRLGPEYVDLNDFENVVKWFVEIARSPHPYTGRDEQLHDQLEELERTWRPLLRASRARPA